jgi:glutathione S-transferase
MNQKIKIWGRTTSINVQKALIALSECTVDYDQEVIGRQYGGTFEPDYCRLNPNGNIPTLEDGDFVLWESNAIVAYICQNYGPAGLCPQAPQQRALCDQWMIWQITSVYPHLRPLYMNELRHDEYDGGDALLKSAPAKMMKSLDILEAQLEGQDFILGEDFTMADIPVGCVLKRWYTLMGEGNRHPNVTAWQQRLNERPSFVAHTNMELE